MRWPWIGRTGLAAVLVMLLLSPAARPADDICGYPARGQVAIHRGDRLLATFTVAEAASVAQRARGLMNCPALKSGTGLLFVYDDIRSRVFWMKDTLLELGILFVAADGRIVAIERGAPGSLKRIPSPGPVRYVLEINYHEAIRLQTGDRMARMRPGSTGKP